MKEARFHQQRQQSQGKPSKLSPTQIKYGSMYLAASNLGMDMRNVKNPQDIERQWFQAARDIEGETGESAEPERKDWEKMLSRGDSYAVGVVQKELPFLYEERQMKLSSLFEDLKGMHTSGIPAKDPTGMDDGQPRRNFYVPSVMVDRDVIANILDKFSKGGVTHSFQGDDLIITAGAYSPDPQEKVLQDLKITIIEIIKFLKDEYKNATGKSLAIGKEESETFDVLSNYTTNHLALCRLTCVYELPDSKAADDAGSEKGEIRGNVPPPIRAK